MWVHRSSKPKAALFRLFSGKAGFFCLFFRTKRLILTENFSEIYLFSAKNISRYFMPIYTRSGDTGETGLMGGRRVSKDDLRVEAYGTIDEANSFLGLAASFSADKQINDIIEKIQRDLFAIGSNLATPIEDKTKISYPIPEITQSSVDSLEKIIDDIEKELPSLKKFILPGGSRAASAIHVARSVVRRAERIVVAFSKQERINPEIIKYLNRLSSLLFELARLANKRANVSEKEWSASD